jgi:hypothetical protein
MTAWSWSACIRRSSRSSKRSNACGARRSSARDAHLVLSRNASEPIPFRVLLDGDAPGSSHGIHVDEHGYGVLDDDRLYQLVRHQDPVRDRTLEITFFEGSAEAHVFTFG